jgi:shikimate dehydrogenase
VVLGAGGAAMAVANALLLQGMAEVTVVNRSIDKAENLRRRFGSKVVPVEWGTGLKF